MLIEHNVYKLYIIKFSKWFMLYMPIIGLFYFDNGLSTMDLFILQAGYSLASGIFEIPSGYMADVVGRKKTLVFGSMMGVFGFLIYVIYPGFWPFLLAEVIMGIGQSFISGSDSAMLYDSLQHSPKRDKYLKYEGRLTSLGGFAETLAAVLGGVIATALSLNAVFVVQVGIAALAIPAALMLVEPPRTKLQKTKQFKQIMEVSKYALFTNKKLSNAIVMSSVIGTATLTMAWTIQVYVVHIALSESETSTLWVALNLVVACISLGAAYILRKVGLKYLLISMIVVIPVTYIMMGLSSFIVLLPFLFVFYFVRGYATPVLKDLIQEQCNSEIRATVLSLRGQLIRLSFAFIGPMIGFVSGKFSFETAVIGVGCLVFVSSLFVFIKHKAYKL